MRGGRGARSRPARPSSRPSADASSMPRASRSPTTRRRVAVTVERKVLVEADGRWPRARRPHRRGSGPAGPAALGADLPLRVSGRDATPGLLRRVRVPTDPGRRERRPCAGPEPAGAAGELPRCGRRGRAGPHVSRAARRQRRPPAGLRRPGQRHRRRPAATVRSPRTRPSGGTGWRRSTTGSCAERTAPRRSRSTRAASSSTGWPRPPRSPAATSSRTSRRRSRPPPSSPCPKRSATARGGGFAADSAAAVVLDVTNGAVVAAASYPAYDPKVWTGGISAGEPRRPAQPCGRHAAGLAGHRRDDAAGLDVQGRLDDGRRGDGRRPRRPVRLHVDVPGGGPRLRELRVPRLRRPVAPAQPRGLLRHDLVPVRVPVLARAGRTRREGRRRRPVRHRGQGVRARRPDRRRPARRGGRARTGPGVEALDVGGRRRPRPARGPTSGYPEVAATDPARADYLKALAVENCDSGWQYRAGDEANFVDRPGRRRGHAAAAGAGVRRGGQRRDAVGSAGGGGDAEPGRVGPHPDPAGGERGPCR